MALVVGLLLLGLGIVALCAWWASVIVFLQGLVACSLVLWGTLTLVVGFAGFKAKREQKAAFQDAPSDLEKTGEEPVAASE